jgi:hypothetical protein
MKKRALLAALAVATMSVAAVGLSSCHLPDPKEAFPFLYETSTSGDNADADSSSAGGTTAATTATMTGYYTSNKKIVWQNMTPTYNYYFMIINEQSIETYDDMTYCFTVTAQMFSNVHYGPEYATEQGESNEQPHIITKYYGTYSVAKSTKSSVTLSLGTPSRVFYAKQGGMYYDTGAWTQAMGNDLAGADGIAKTAEEYLQSKLVTTVTEYNDAGEATGTKDVELFPSEGTEVYCATKTCAFTILDAFVLSYIS